MNLSTYLSFLVFKVLLLFGSTSVSFAKSKIHTKIDLNDLRKVFQVDNYDQVPDYDIVNVRLLSKREASNEADESKNVHLRAFGQDLNLNLKPNLDFNERIKNMKIFMASTHSGRLKYSQENIGKDVSELGKPYHDESNMAAIVVSHDSQGRLQMDGTIGNNLVIKPLPVSFSDTNSKDFRDDDELFLDEDDKISSNKTNQTRLDTSSFRYQIPKLHNLNKRKSLSGHKSAHIVFKKLKKEDEHYSDYLELESKVSWSTLGNNKSKHFESKRKRYKRQAPDTVWPEVLLVIDYDSFLLHGANSRDVKKYFISFWNGVDLRYKLLVTPSIRVSLAGMIVAKDREATPYLERNRLRQPNADAVDAAGALTDMGKYLYREDRLPTYDLAVVITKLDMCRRRYEGGRCNRGTAGFAYVGGACVVNKRLEKVNSVAIIEDSGGFSGIIVAAHEVGHLLGCVHDGSPPPSYLGGPGATRCPWEDGFIMSDLRHTERGFRWSSCSVEQFKHFLNGETATCLYNYPHENQLLPRVLPGTMLSLDEQCKRDRGTNACFKDARVCAQLFCFDSSSGYCVSYRPAAEGSPCGDGQVCKNGKCTTEIENIIPDYTHVTQTISRSPLSRSDTSGPLITHRNYYSRFRHRTGLLRPSSEQKLNSPSSTPTSIQDVNDNCRDIVQTIGGSMTCREFLEVYSYRYCNHNYVKRNCCATHALICGV